MKIKLADPEVIKSPNITFSKPWNYDVIIITIVAKRTDKLEQLLTNKLVTFDVRELDN